MARKKANNVQELLDTIKELEALVKLRDEELDRLNTGHLTYVLTNNNYKRKAEALQQELEMANKINLSNTQAYFESVEIQVENTKRQTAQKLDILNGRYEGMKDALLLVAAARNER